MGNYDDGVGFDRDDCGCAYREAEEKHRGDLSLAWTRAHVTAENKAFLRPAQGDPLRGGRQASAARAWQSSQDQRIPFRGPCDLELRRLAASSNADVIVFGHTHKPYTKVVNGVLFVNVGSVRKPKDGDWRACYAVIDISRRAASCSSCGWNTPSSGSPPLFDIANSHVDLPRTSSTGACAPTRVALTPEASTTRKTERRE